MDFYGCHFEYAGELSRKYGLIIASIDATRNIQLSGKSESVSIFNKRNQVKYDLGNTYAEAPLVFDMEVVAEEPFEGEWRRKIQAWLFNQRGYQRLYLDRMDDCPGETYDLVNGSPKRMYLNCKFVNPEKIEGNGGIIGYKFSVECDSRMAWQDPISIRKMFDGGIDQEEDVVIVVDTDSNEYTYPTLSVTTGDVGGVVAITNMTDSEDRKTAFSDIPSNTTFTINGTFNYISDGFYQHFVDRNFPRLLNGKNAILLEGDIVSISFQWQNMRYL